MTKKQAAKNVKAEEFIQNWSRIEVLVNKQLEGQMSAMRVGSSVRELEKEMFDYLEKKLAKNGLYQDALKRKDPRTIMGLAAMALVGIQEATGRNDGKMVKLIQLTVGGANGEPWCAALVMTCIAFAEEKTGIKSEVFPSELCYAVWTKTPKRLRVKKIPAQFAIAIWKDVGKTTGHMEFVVSCDGVNFQGVGGNTSGTVDPSQPVNREGNGVFYTSRSMKSSKTRELLGFIRPFELVAA
jgi:hypothetical protein